jgi:hypothetical protein
MIKSRASIRPLDPTQAGNIKELDLEGDVEKALKNRPIKKKKKVVSPVQAGKNQGEKEKDNQLRDNGAAKPDQGKIQNRPCVRNLREHYGSKNSNTGGVVKCFKSPCSLLHYEALVS